MRRKLMTLGQPDPPKIVRDAASQDGSCLWCCGRWWKDATRLDAWRSRERDGFSHGDLSWWRETTNSGSQIPQLERLFVPMFVYYSVIQFCKWALPTKFPDVDRVHFCLSVGQTSLGYSVCSNGRLEDYGWIDAVMCLLRHASDPHDWWLSGVCCSPCYA